MSQQAGHLSPLLQQSSGITAARGEGMYLFDEQDKRYLDFTSGIGVTSTGHCHPRVVEAVQAQAARLIHGQYAIVKHPNALRLCERLGELTPEGIDSFFFVNAGSEAVEAALRLARQATGRPNIIVFHGGFHGRTMGALSMTTSSVGLRAGLQPTMGGVVVAPFPDTYRYGWDRKTATEFCLRELDHIFHTISSPKETAALLIEPVQGEAGYVPANTAFMQGLRERCDHHDLLLIVDEVQAGNGRTGRYWGHEHYGVRPDVLVTAKGLASGFPLSVMGAPEALMAKGWPGSQGGTYGGNAVACAAALATLDVIRDEGLVENAAEQGAYLRARLDVLEERHACIGNVRGQGLMQGAVIVNEAGEPDGERAGRLLKAAEERGLLLIRCGAYGGQIVRWLPPLIVNREQIDQAVDTFEEALRATA
ncbi:aspartate aminotransferase family protein [Alkalilimnicola sp. S0819]|uniref:aspartate aminotransferase family protein n=1 Tax=Alkalilimnicola sp. S0819 TaxID=2613922 RepID=UPI001261D12E|nr:aminotransferase class III-fold pyridoxal phosphate-dependent enzyme [Alkalilimnicola sp. S0819]KAB7619657.1 aminotransferase class III-fold pyridoxal phosphate-dependent enzyme [Alkalilimnicola sp. S0819]MPQ17595.1 aminotransferase class III-fold pyridoxal phosphate-dependent enzyme [Alkalilimnicola sp. S0819]